MSRTNAFWARELAVTVATGEQLARAPVKAAIRCTWVTNRQICIAQVVTDYVLRDVVRFWMMLWSFDIAKTLGLLSEVSCIFSRYEARCVRR